MINQKGFSLVELIVVVAILGVVTAVAVPNYLNYLYTSRIGSDISTARELARAAEAYCAVHGLLEVPDSFAWSEADSYIPRTASNGDCFSYSMSGTSVFVHFTATDEKSGKYAGEYVIAAYGNLPSPAQGGFDMSSGS